MKIYVDFKTHRMKEVNKRPFDMGQNLDNVVEVYVKDNLSDTYFVQLQFITPDGRKPAIYAADALLDSEPSYVDYDGSTYRYQRFTLTNEVTKKSGRLQITAFINFTVGDEDDVKTRAVLFDCVNDIRNTTGYPDNTLLMFETVDGENIIRDIRTFLNNYLSVLATKLNENDLKNAVLDIITKSVDTNKLYTQYIGYDNIDYNYIEIGHSTTLENGVRKTLRFNNLHGLYVTADEFTLNGYKVVTTDTKDFTNDYYKFIADDGDENGLFSVFASDKVNIESTDSNLMLSGDRATLSASSILMLTGNYINIGNNAMSNIRFSSLPKYMDTPLATTEDTNNKVNKSEFDAYKTTHNAEVEAVKTGIINRLNTIENAIKSNNIDFDTLQEISDWITANMSSDAETLIEKITDILNRVGILEASDGLRDEAVENMGARIDEKIAQVQPFINEWLNDIKPYFENIKGLIENNYRAGGYKLIVEDGKLILDIKSI